MTSIADVFRTLLSGRNNAQMDNAPMRPVRSGAGGVVRSGTGSPVMSRDFNAAPRAPIEERALTPRGVSDAEVMAAFDSVRRGAPLPGVSDLTMRLGQDSSIAKAVISALMREPPMQMQPLAPEGPEIFPQPELYESTEIIGRPLAPVPARKRTIGGYH